MDTLQDFLINKRNELNLSLRDAAKIIGISHSYLSTLEKGFEPRKNTPVKPTPETLQLISSAYDVPYETLMKFSGYLHGDTTASQKLSEKDEKDIAKRLENLRKDLYENSEGLMFSGEPLSQEAKESILEILALGVRQAKRLNKKFTPKKYKK